MLRIKNARIPTTKAGTNIHYIIEHSNISRIWLDDNWMFKIKHFSR